ncbi:hypothetical protein NIES267_36270 [Calothrix parasitica NIES-267]|uniref:Uncharacterized protein n=1 Tax=Calothrix parasitica NIES-267 TaxID=1973488 RepID=A0A1Z4LSJ4_9CYAN|nr:hypothetical protein NIES267_36270 [Calothrix parasitica NIES-267]
MEAMITGRFNWVISSGHATKTASPGKFLRLEAPGFIRGWRFLFFVEAPKFYLWGINYELRITNYELYSLHQVNF